MEPLVLLDYPIVNEKLLLEAEMAKSNSLPYTDSRYPDLKLENWHIGHYSSPTIDAIMRDFKITGKARFYWLEPFAEIPEHIDNNTQCSINFILSKEPAPILIEGKEYNYKQALLNTTLPHSVKNGEKERIMLKISIFDHSFTDVLIRIPDVYKL